MSSILEKFHVGFDVTQALTLRNEGQRPLEIIGFDISPAASNFAIEGSTFLIAAKGSVTLVIHFMPEQVQDYEATVRFSHDGNNQETSQVTLRGTGVSAFRCEPCGNNPTECFDGATLISYGCGWLRKRAVPVRGRPRGLRMWL